MKYGGGRESSRRLDPFWFSSRLPALNLNREYVDFSLTRDLIGFSKREHPSFGSYLAASRPYLHLLHPDQFNLACG